MTVRFRVNEDPAIFSTFRDGVGDVTIIFGHAATFGFGHRQEKQFTFLVREIAKSKKGIQEISVDGRHYVVQRGSRIVIPLATTFTDDIGTAVVTKPLTIEVVDVC